MNKALLPFLMILTSISFSQTATEIYLFDINKKFELSDPVNVSENPGVYDNQPYFTKDGQLYYVSSRRGQTDVRSYSLLAKKNSWLSETDASEYSPQTSGDNEISAIKLETNGAQGLFEYKRKRLQVVPKPMVPKAVAAYYIWYNNSTVVGAVIEDGKLNMHKLRPSKNTSQLLEKNVGRSFHKIPKSKLISYISKEKDDWEIRSVNPKKGNIGFITKTLKGKEDICWTPKGVILATKGTEIFKFDPKKDTTWQLVADIKDFNLGKASRIAIHQSGKRLALVVEEHLPPAETVDRLISASNNRDIEAFFKECTPKVNTFDFPNEKTNRNTKAFRKLVEVNFNKSKNTFINILNRISFKQYIIQQEEITTGDQKQIRTRMYKVVDGLIEKIIDLKEGTVSEDKAEKIVQQQLDAYNAKNIEAFASTFSKDVTAYYFPDAFSFKGKGKLKSIYKNFFEETPDLHCELKNRIVVGNMVIDHEYLTVNGNNYGALAFYEINDGMITKITFIQ